MQTQDWQLCDCKKSTNTSGFLRAKKQIAGFVRLSHWWHSQIGAILVHPQNAACFKSPSSPTRWMWTNIITNISITVAVAALSCKSAFCDFWTLWFWFGCGILQWFTWWTQSQPGKIWICILTFLYIPRCLSQRIGMMCVSNAFVDAFWLCCTTTPNHIASSFHKGNLKISQYQSQQIWSLELTKASPYLGAGVLITGYQVSKSVSCLRLATMPTTTFLYLIDYDRII